MLILVLALLGLPCAQSQSSQNLRLQGSVEQTLWTNTSKSGIRGGTNFRQPAQLLLEAPNGQIMEVEINGEVHLLSEPTSFQSENWNIRNPSGKLLKLSIINP
jgi:hypothetical protein